MITAKNCVRIHMQTALDDKAFADLIGMLSGYLVAIPQITFFMALSHPPMPLGLAERYAAVLAGRMREAEQTGFECGINILATIGHHEENLGNSIDDDYTRMTNICGQRCMGSFCPNDEGMRGYITRLYRIAAGAKPSYIWTDDDVRFGHMPVGYGCFCDNCLKIFADECGKHYTRDGLREAFESESERQRPELGLKWLEHNRNTLNRLFALIEKTVSDTDPDISLGFMTGERYYEGYGFAAIADILRGKGREVYWRPGGGAYTDETLYALVEKSHQIGRQVSLLPAHVKLIQSEIENFPYQMLKKGPAATALEAASHIAAGCTGAAFNIISEGTGEKKGDFRPLLDKIAETQLFYDLLVKHFGRRPPAGIYTGWTIDSQAACGMTPDGWSAHTGGVGRLTGDHAKELLELGLPVSYTLDDAAAVTLFGDGVKAMAPEMIAKILSGGVYMDGRALDNLNMMGYGDLTGFRLRGFLYKDCIERYTGHPLNSGGVAGGERNGMQAFYRGDAAVIDAADRSAEILSYMVDYNGNTISECAMGIFKNKLGGRVCVAGYYPWELTQSLTKARQMKDVFIWLSDGKLPSYIDSYNKIHNWTRRLGDGRTAAALINASLDEVKNVVLAAQTGGDSCVMYDMSCARHDCPIAESHAVPPGYKAFALPPIKPWQMVLAVWK